MMAPTCNKVREDTDRECNDSHRPSTEDVRNGAKRECTLRFEVFYNPKKLHLHEEHQLTAEYSSELYLGE